MRARAMVVVTLLLGGALGTTAAAELETVNAQIFPLVTNVQQLHQLALQERRVLCSFRLEGVVCSADAAMERVVLLDESGAELLELDLAGRQLAPGDRVAVEGQHCSVAIAGSGLAIGRAAVVDNDGIHPMLRRSGMVYLSAGRHPLRLLWFNSRDRYGLKVSYQGPGLDRQPVPDAALFRTEPDPVTGLTNMVNGLDYRCYEGAWWNLASGFGHDNAVKTGHANNFDLGLRTRNERVGLEFSGFVEVQREGLYTFDTESDDGSRLFVSEPAPNLERVGAATPPTPRRLVVAQVLREEDETQWAEVEGTVAFAGETGGGLDLEVRADTGRMKLAVADGSGLSPTLLLHRRIRAVGVSRGVHSLEGPSVLGSLSMLSGADISLIESAPGGTPELPLLTTADQVKRLRREEAQRGYPVRLRGVITRAVRGYDSIVLQDTSRGVFVRGMPTRSPGTPQLGEYWEIEGTTAPGDFAPVVNWRLGRRLGPGRLPEPVAATWDQLMNGSLDTQYVELQGIVTAVGPNRLELLLREGKIILGFLDREPGMLSGFENTRIRVRGCLFPSWNAKTHRVNVGEMNISSAELCVEEPAPLDLFSTPAKRATELFLFDPGAGAFQRVKVAGQFLCERPGLCFMTDGTNGVRFQSRATHNLQPGDLVEVVGFPELGGPSPLLREAVARQTGHADLPEPEDLLAGNWLDAGHDARRVQVDGLLVNQRIERSEQVLELQSGWRTFVARLQSKGNLARPVPLGSRLQLTGVYASQGGNRALGREVDSFELLVNSAADIRVLARPPWLTLPRLLGALGIVGTILLGATLWALSLRRRVNAQTAIIRQKAQREAALEERARIAKDIHDDLGSSLTRIAMLSDLAEADKTRPEQVEVHVRKIAGSARETVRSLDEIVWAISPENDTWTSLAEYLSRYASECFESTNIRCRLELPLDLPAYPLSSEARHGLFLVIKEAFHNVLKHSQASLVHLRVAETAAGLEIAIRDDGCGFDPGKAPNGGNGLANMRARMAALGGQFRLESAPRQGTNLTILIRP